MLRYGRGLNHATCEFVISCAPPSIAQKAAFLYPERSSPHLAMCISRDDVWALYAQAASRLIRNRVGLRSSTKPERRKAGLAADISWDDAKAHFALASRSSTNTKTGRSRIGEAPVDETVFRIVYLTGCCLGLPCTNSNKAYNVVSLHQRCRLFSRLFIIN